MGGSATTKGATARRALRRVRSLTPQEVLYAR